MASTMKQQHLTVIEAAAILGISRQGVERAVSRGRLVPDLQHNHVKLFSGKTIAIYAETRRKGKFLHKEG